MSFLEELSRAKAEKKSSLCVGLDPASIFLRETNCVPRTYFEKADEKTALLNFCLDVIEKTAPYCAAFKPNQQYLFPFSFDDYFSLNRAIHDAGCVSIMDCKLGDIGSTNEAAFYWLKKTGFDALTFSPFAGNVAEAVEAAHSRKLGLFVLTLMSNPEARFFMRDSIICGGKGYAWIARQAAMHSVDGCVVGATSNASELREVIGIAGSEKSFLVPGVGAQGGSLETTVSVLGESALVNVSRGITCEEDAGKAARAWREKINSLLARKN